MKEKIKNDEPVIDLKRAIKDQILRLRQQMCDLKDPIDIQIFSDKIFDLENYLRRL